MLVSSFICSRIDYCNAVFAGLPRSTTNHLDSVLHAAARMISGRSQYDHMTSILRDKLHWLPVPQRVIYKLCLTTYKAIKKLHLATLLLCACLRQRTRLVYTYVLLTHVSYFSREPKLHSGNRPLRMWNLTHGMTCRLLCEHQQPSSGSNRP